MNCSTIFDTLNQLQVSLGADAVHWSVTVHFTDGYSDARWPLSGVAPSGDFLHLTRDGAVCLVPQSRIQKISVFDTRRQFKQTGEL